MSDKATLSSDEGVDTPPQAIMVYLNGSKRSFRCECGCNVFHHPFFGRETYECNGCGLLYKGEA